jgi:hypothetical protein
MVADTGADSSGAGTSRTGNRPMAARDACESSNELDQLTAEVIGGFPRTGCVSGQAWCARILSERGQTQPATLAPL